MRSFLKIPVPAVIIGGITNSTVAVQIKIIPEVIERLHYWLRDDWLSLPFAKKLDCPDVEAYTIDGFLTAGDCIAEFDAKEQKRKKSLKDTISLDLYSLNGYYG